MVARVGGDEFAVIQTGVERTDRHRDAGATHLRHDRRALRSGRPRRRGGHQHRHRVGAERRHGAERAPQERRHGPLPAKADGRGTYRFFEPEMDARMKARRTLEIALRAALANGEFELHYQPLVNLDDDRITCCEALLRWRHPERGMIPPAEFIPIAEEIGLIVRSANGCCARPAPTPRTGPTTSGSRSTSRRSSSMQRNLLDGRDWRPGGRRAAGEPARARDHRIGPDAEHRDDLATLHRLRELGVRISMDDFGTGYSSLSYLRSFPFDKIKIDRCFINGLTTGDDSAAIVLAIAGLAEELSASPRPPRAWRRASSCNRSRPWAAARCRAISSARRGRRASSCKCSGSRARRTPRPKSGAALRALPRSDSNREVLRADAGERPHRNSGVGSKQSRMLDQRVAVGHAGDEVGDAAHAARLVDRFELWTHSAGISPVPQHNARTGRVRRPPPPP